MIPYAIMSVKIVGVLEQDLRVRVLELGEDMFTFRLAKRYDFASCIQRDKAHMLVFCTCFLWDTAEYVTHQICEFDLSQEEETAFYRTYRMSFRDEAVQFTVRQLMKDYMRYINLKLAGDDAALAKELCGYPAELEQIYPDDHYSWKRRLFAKAVQDVDAEWESVFGQVPQLAVELDHPSAYERFLQTDIHTYMKEYWEDNGLSDHPIASRNIDAVHIGNQYCRHLFPDPAILPTLTRHASDQNLTVTIALPPIDEDSRTNWCQAPLDFIDHADIALDILVNDPGTQHYLTEKYRNRSNLRIITGILMDKRRRDVRKKRCQAPSTFLYLPFYQMNTATQCTLYAAYKYGDRGKHCYQKQCDHICEKYGFLYPEFLQMTGRYNSLFGYDEKLLTDSAYLRRCLAPFDENAKQEGCLAPERIVIGLL